MNLYHNVYSIFIDIQAAYDSVDREKVIQILGKHGVGETERNILISYWSQMRIKVMRNKVYGRSFHPSFGVIQGDPLSPFLFNLIIDVALRTMDRQIPSAIVQHNLIPRRCLRISRHFMPMMASWLTSIRS